MTTIDTGRFKIAGEQPEVMRRRIEAIFLAAGKDMAGLPVEREIDAYCELAEMPYYADSYRKRGMPLPNNRMEWAALAEWLDVSASDFASGKVRPGELLGRLAARTRKPQSGRRARSGKGMTWRQAIKAAEDHCSRNLFPGVNALAKLIDCLPSTMCKAVDRSPALRVMLADLEAARRKESAMTEKVIDSTQQTREIDPADGASRSTDDVFRRLMEKATPAERAKLNAMNQYQRRELVALAEYDPDNRRE